MNDAVQSGTNTENVSPLVKSRPFKDLVKWLVELPGDRCTFGKLAEQIGCSESYLYRIMKRQETSDAVDEQIKVLTVKDRIELYQNAKALSSKREGAMRFLSERFEGWTNQNTPQHNQILIFNLPNSDTALDLTALNKEKEDSNRIEVDDN